MTVRIMKDTAGMPASHGILEEGGSAENCTVENSEVTGSRLTGGMFGITRGRRHRAVSYRDTSVTAEAKLSNPGGGWAG